jgi:hypothetical protein
MIPQSYSYREVMASDLFIGPKLEHDRPRHDARRIEQPWDSWHRSLEINQKAQARCRKCAIRSKLTWPAAVTRNAEGRCNAN